jgi:hypothetical protein
MIINHDQDGTESHPTLFGFKTENKFAANMLNTVYGIVMIVALAFAYHALSLILVDWNAGLTFLAALAVVGLPYCIKIILYGRKEFFRNMALLCVAISMLPTIFDFIGFYSETSIRQSLINTKFEVLETVNYFDKEAREKLNKNIIELDKEFNASLTDLEKSKNQKMSDLTRQIVDAEQTYIDETEGVSGRITTGKVGIGPKAKELESELRKTEANVELAKKQLESDKQREIQKLQKDYDTRLKSYQEGIEAINSLVSSEDKEGLVFQVNRAKTFDELADVLVELNTGINTVSSKLGVEPKYVKFSTENVIQLSFGALFRGEITAVICFALALLLEVVDTVIVYMVRGAKRKPEKKAEEEKPNPVRETIHYNWENKKEEGKIITDLKEEKIDPEHIHLYHK